MARALDGHELPVVGDPACGGGAILLAAARHLEARGEAPADVVTRLWARDVDPIAVATTEAALTIWAGTSPAPARCTVGDALVDDPGWPPLDVVVGNPPFLTPLATATARSAPRTAGLRARFGEAVGAYTDVAALFLVAACELARPGGTVALVQPTSVLTNRDAGGVRAAVERAGAVREVLVPSARAFEAAVDVCIPVIDLGAAGQPAPVADAPGGTSWAAHLTGPLGVPTVALGGSHRLGDVAEVLAAIRSEYYATVPHVHEEADCPHGRPLLTTGLVDLGGTSWGARPARVDRRSWTRPVVDVDALEGRAATWVERTAAPKVVVATQTKVVEAAVDAEGRFVPGVPLVVVRPDPARLWHTAAALASPAVSAWLFHRSAGSGLSTRALRVSAPLLRDVPLPPDDTAWDEGAAAFRDRDLHAFAGAMDRAYGVGPPIAAWWMPLATSVWSPAPVLR